MVQEAEWYYAAGGEAKGPYSEEALEQFAQQGVINRDTLVWTTRLSGWLPYGRIKPGALGQATCAVCGVQHPHEQMLSLFGHSICPACKPAYVQCLREGIAPPNTVLYGGFWPRLGAKVIDGALVGFFILVIASWIGVILLPVLDNDDWFPFLFSGMQMGFSLVSTVLGAAYYTWFVGKFGATAGKMAFGLRVVTQELGRVSYLRAFARYWAEMLSGMILYIGYIMAAFDNQKRALHDHICGTRVVVAGRRRS